MTNHLLWSTCGFLAFCRRFVRCGVHGFHGTGFPSLLIGEKRLDELRHAALSGDGAVQDPEEVFE